MTRAFPIPVEPSPHVLRPFNPKEAVSVAEAARRAGKSAAHMRRLVDQYDLGRRVGGGHWQVSLVLLLAFLDGNARAWQAYREGRRDDPAVMPSRGLRKLPNSRWDQKGRWLVYPHPHGLPIR